jgi:hypothetical protein
LDEKRVIQLQQEVNEQRALIQRLVQHVEEHSGFNAGEQDLAQVYEARTKLEDLKAKLTRKTSNLQKSRSEAGADHPEDSVGC